MMQDLSVSLRSNLQFSNSYKKKLAKKKKSNIFHLTQYLESLLDCREIKSVDPKENQS